MSKQIKSILFLTDFSERADRATGEVSSLAKRLDAKLVIGHLYSRPVPSNSTYVDRDNHMLKAKESWIDRRFEFLKDIFPDLKSPKVTFRRSLSIFEEGVQKLLREEPADIVVMATKGAYGYGGFWGSKTYRLSQIVDLPVLGLPDNSQLGDIKRIGIATDFNPGTKLGSIGILHELAMTYKARIDIIHVTPEKHKDVQTIESKVAVKLHESLQSLEHTFNYAKNEDVTQGLMDFCLQKGIGLVAVLDTDRNPVKEMFHLSTTEDITQRLKLPFLIMN